jgi:hypothetical protein
MAMKVTNLNEKAMLVKLTMRRTNLLKRDVDAEEFIKRALEDESLTVNSRLFKQPGNPIADIITENGRAYQYHKLHTHPFVDRGPRVLKNALHPDYCEGMRVCTNALSNIMARHMPQYDDHVLADIKWRNRQSELSGKPPRAQVSDYPTAQQFSDSMSIEIRFRPFPDRKHFLFDISDEEEAQFQAEMDEVGSMITANTVVQMLKPLKHLADTLKVPIGTKDEEGRRLGIFRDSAVENIVEGLELAKKLVIDPSPELQQTMADLDTAITYWAEKKDWLRESPINREAAAKKLDEIAQQMAGFMGVAP